LQSVKR